MNVCIDAEDFDSGGQRTSEADAEDAACTTDGVLGDSAGGGPRPWPQAPLLPRDP